MTSFDEKKKGDLGRVNGGFFVLNKKIFNYIDNDNTIFEKYPLEKLSQEKQLMAFNHSGFWQPMDNLRDMNLLQKLWNDGGCTMENLARLKNFWKNKNVLITGHSGFKGTWLTLFLQNLGANVYGCSLKPITNPSFF